MSNLGICASDDIYQDAIWYSYDHRPTLPTIIRNGNLRHLRLLGAAQANEAITRAVETRANTDVHWRHMLHPPPGSDDATDDGMWMLPPAEWRENVYFAKHLRYSYDRVKMYVSTNNEFSTNNEGELAHYIEWESQRAWEATTFGMRLDMLSFPTHYPTFHGKADSPVRNWLKQGKFDALFMAIADNQGPVDEPRIWCLPNAYVHPGNLDGLRNVVAIYKRFLQVTGKRPHMALGEYGYAKFSGQQFDPHGGHLSDNTITARQTLKFMVDQYNLRLLPYGIGAMVYTVAGQLGGNEVQTFRYSLRDLEYLAELAAAPIGDDTGPVIIPIEPPDEPDTKPIVPVVAIERAVLERQLATCRDVQQTLHREMNAVSSTIQTTDQQISTMQMQIQLHKAQLEQMDKSANQMQSIILTLELALEVTEAADDAA